MKLKLYEIIKSKYAERLKLYDLFQLDFCRMAATRYAVTGLSGSGQTAKNLTGCAVTGLSVSGPTNVHQISW